MAPYPDIQIHAYAAGLLEPGDALVMERRLRARPELRARHKQILALLQTPTIAALGPWPSAQVEAVAVLDTTRRDVRIRLHAYAAHLPVLFRVEHGLPRLEHPTSPEGFVPLQAFTRDDGYELRVQLASTEEAVLVLLPPQTPFAPPTSAVWTQAWDDALAGRLPAWRLRGGQA